MIKQAKSTPIERCASFFQNYTQKSEHPKVLAFSISYSSNFE